MCTTETMPAKKAFLIAEDLLQTGRAHNITLTDQYDSTWTMKELKKFVQEIEEEPQNVRVYFDAGFDKASTKAGLGVVIYYEQNRKERRHRQNRQVDSFVTNNDAEYGALHLAVQLLEELGVRQQSVHIVGDSKVVIQQMAGEWPVYEQQLASWCDKIESQLTKLQIEATYEHIAREENNEAHKLATQALNGVDIQSKTTL